VTRWEYKTIYADVDRLNELGADGWELVATVYRANAERTICYLKRPLT